MKSVENSGKRFFIILGVTQKASIPKPRILDILKLESGWKSPLLIFEERFLIKIKAGETDTVEIKSSNKFLLMAVYS